MKVIYTDEALLDLDEILAFIELNYPTILAAFEKRLRSVEQRIGRWPKSAEEVEQRPGVRRRSVHSVSVQTLLPDRQRCDRRPSHPPCGPSRAVGK